MVNIKEHGRKTMCSNLKKQFIIPTKNGNLLIIRIRSAQQITRLISQHLPPLKILGRVRCEYGDYESREQIVQSIGILVYSNLVLTMADNVFRRYHQQQPLPYKMSFFFQNKEYVIDNYEIDSKYRLDNTFQQTNLALLRLRTPIQKSQYAIIKQWRQQMGDIAFVKGGDFIGNTIKQKYMKINIPKYNQNIYQPIKQLKQYNKCPIFQQRNCPQLIGFFQYNQKAMMFTKNSIDSINFMETKITKTKKIAISSPTYELRKKEKFPQCCIGIVCKQINLQQYSTGTGFLISKNLVLTCLSNLINPKKISQIQQTEDYSNIYFKLQNSQKINIKKVIYLPKLLYSNKYQPGQNIAILLLNTSIDLPEYIGLTYDCNQTTMNCNIKGYSKSVGEKYTRFTERNVALNKDQNQSIFTYVCRKKQGSAGSPLFCKFSGNAIYAVGMHIGDQIKYSFTDVVGLKFTKNTIDIIKKVQMQLTFSENIRTIDFNTRKLLGQSKFQQSRTSLKYQIDQMQKSISMANSKDGNMPMVKMAKQYLSLGCKYIQNGEFLKAKSKLEESKKLFITAVGDQDPNLIHVYHNLGYVFKEQGQYGKALEMFQRAVNLHNFNQSKDTGVLAMIYNSIGVTHKGQGSLALALSNFNKALKILEKYNGGKDTYTSLVYNNMAQIFIANGNYKEAKQTFEKVKQIQQKELGPDNPTISLAKTYSNLANVYISEGQKSKGLQYRHLALRAMKILNLSEHPLYENIIRDLQNDSQVFLNDEKICKQDIQTCIMILCKFSPHSKYIKVLQQCL